MGLKNTEFLNDFSNALSVLSVALLVTGCILFILVKMQVIYDTAWFTLFAESTLLTSSALSCLDILLRRSTDSSTEFILVRSVEFQALNLLTVLLCIVLFFLLTVLDQHELELYQLVVTALIGLVSYIVTTASRHSVAAPELQQPESKVWQNLWLATFVFFSIAIFLRGENQSPTYITWSIGCLNLFVLPGFNLYMCLESTITNLVERLFYAIVLSLSSQVICWMWLTWFGGYLSYDTTLAISGCISTLSIILTYIQRKNKTASA